MDDFEEALNKAFRAPSTRLFTRYVNFPKVEIGELEECLATLRHGMSTLEPLTLPIRECRILPDTSEIRKAVASLEALAAGLGEETADTRYLRRMAYELVAEGREQLGDGPGCIAALREAEQIAKRGTNAGDQCLLILRLTEALAKSGARQESIAVAKEAAHLAAGLDDWEQKDGCYTLCGLSRILAGIGALEESLGMAAKAVEIAEGIYGTMYNTKVPRLPAALLQLAEVHHLRGELPAAEAALLRAKALWEDGPPMRMNENVGTCLHQLARIREEGGDMAGSIGFHREAVDFWRRYRDRLGFANSPRACGALAQAFGNLGTALTRERQWHEAAPALENALMLFRALGKSESPEAREYAANLDTCRAALADAEPDAQKKGQVPQHE